MSTTTPYYDLVKPVVGNATDQDLWGYQINDDLDIIDSQLLVASNWVNRVVTTADTATVSDSKKILLCNATGGAFSETLPLAATAGDGFTIAIKKTDSSSNAVTVTRSGSDTIDNSTTIVLNSQNESIQLVSDGISSWNSIAKDPTVSIPDASISTKGLIQIATDAEVATGSDSLKAVVPSAVSSHNGVFKAWVAFNGSGGAAILDSYNITSVSRLSTGRYVVTPSNVPPDSNVGIMITLGEGGTSLPSSQVLSRSSTNFTISCTAGGSGTAFDFSYVFVGFVWTE